MSPLTGRALIGRIFLGTIPGLVTLAAVAFGVDFGVFRIRDTTNHHAYGSVVVTQYYAVLQKNGKTQFIFNPPGPQSCVKALFPHAGLLPCCTCADIPSGGPISRPHSGELTGFYSDANGAFSQLHRVPDVCVLPELPE